MKNLIKQMIIDFHHEMIPVPHMRNINLQEQKNIRRAHVLMGMRRTGKTWLMYQHMQNLIKAKRPVEKLLYINFEDDRLISFNTHHLQEIVSAYFDLYPQYANDEEVVFYFDEIHIIDGWEKFIRRLLDKEKMSLFVTGSSAKMLSKEIATNLRGRATATEVFPFSFSEYLHFHKVPDDLAGSSKNKSLIRNHCQNYLRFGGFPETLYIPSDQHRDLLQEYVNAVIFRDVVDRYQISNTHVVKLFLIHCLQNLSSPLSITKIYHALKSNGATVGKNSLYEYLDYFEEAYLLFAVPIYNLSLRKRQVNPKKIYSIDPGILQAYSVNSNFSLGPVFENAVFLQLRRHYSDIFYYKTTSSKEIDFVVLNSQGDLQLYQSCLDLSSEKTKIREISALIEAANELKATALYIITLDEEDEIMENGNTIKLIPFWKWAGQ